MIGLLRRFSYGQMWAIIVCKWYQEDIVSSGYSPEVIHNEVDSVNQVNQMNPMNAHSAVCQPKLRGLEID